jgi:dipeptidase E
MKRLLLLSNGTITGQEYLEHARIWIASHFRASAQASKTILFIPYALHNHEAYAEKAARALAPLGINTISAHATDDPSARLDGVDGICVGGGNTFRLLKMLQETELLSAIKERVDAGMPYLGVSAGTNVAGPTIKTTNDMPIVQPESLDAMSLVPFQINPHYVDGALYYKELNNTVLYNGETRAERIAEFHEENSMPVLALREGTALSVTGTALVLLGDKPAKLFRQGKDPVDITDGKSLSVLVSPLYVSDIHEP